MIEYKYDKETIEKKRTNISKELMKASINIKSEVIKEIAPSDLKVLFELYDSMFLNNWFKDNFKGHLKFSVSSRMTKSAGLTLCPKNISKLKPEEVVIEFRIGKDFLLQYGILEGVKVVGGIEARNSIEALQLVLEHEICHAIEFIYFYKSSCRGERFKTIVKNLFGHTSSYHQLPTNRQIAKEKFGFSVGDKVSFTFKEKRFIGFIYRINKRATVMVQDKAGQYADKQGNRYLKYYIPLNKLD